MTEILKGFFDSLRRNPHRGLRLWYFSGKFRIIYPALQTIASEETRKRRKKYESHRHCKTR